LSKELLDRNEDIERTRYQMIKRERKTGRRGEKETYARKADIESIPVHGIK
jgi:hypothetical protein